MSSLLRNCAISAALAIGMSVATVGNLSAQDMTDTERELYEAAQAEGPVTWYVVQYASDTADQIAASFAERYPGLSVNVVRSTAQVAFQRLQQELQAGAVQVDILSTTDNSQYVELKEQGHIAQYTPENEAMMAEEFRGVDPDGYFHVTTLSTVAILYNTEMLEREDAPQSWEDLLDEKWRGQISMGHPGFSGTVGLWALLVKRLYGAEYFDRLAANEPHVGRSIQDTVTMLNSGERAIGIGVGSQGHEQNMRGAPIDVIYPRDGTLLTVTASAVLEAAPSPNGARLFMDYLLGPEVAVVHAEKEHRPPLRIDAPEGAAVPPLEEMQPATVPVEEVTEGMSIVIEDFRDAFGI